MATILVAGGAGYIGSHVCRALAEAGHVPVVFDDFSTGWRDAVRFGPVEPGDMADAAALARVCARHRPAAALQFAALSLVGESMQAPARYWQANVLGAVNLARAAAEAGARAVIFSSTAAVYGEAEGLELISESAPCRPTNPYGASKLAAERAIADIAAAGGMATGVFRYFNVAGAAPAAGLGEQHRPETHLIPILLEVALGQRAAISVHGADYPTPDGTCIRDYLHVEDLAAAHVAGLAHLLDGQGGGHPQSRHRPGPLGARGAGGSAPGDRPCDPRDRCPPPGGRSGAAGLRRECRDGAAGLASRAQRSRAHDRRCLGLVAGPGFAA